MPQLGLVDKIKSRLLSDVAGYVERLVPDGHREGAEWVARNPKRADDSPGSFKINLQNGRWSDFAINKGGDIVDLAAYILDADYKGIADWLNLPAHAHAPAPRPAVSEAPPSHGVPAADWKCIGPATREPSAFELRWNEKKPSATWRYLDTEGRVIGIVARFDFIDAEGKPRKDLLPLTFCRNGTQTMWRWKAWPGMPKRPLFNLPALVSDAARPVLIVEGEKCATAAQAALPEFAVVTWQGGGKAVTRADWAPLHGRTVLVWPDADTPGHAAAFAIFGALGGKADVRLLTPPAGKPEGWDVADAIAEGWNADALREFLRTAPDLPKPVPPSADKPAVVTAGAAVSAHVDELIEREGFDLLGFHDDRFFFFQREGRYILGLKASEIERNKSALASNQWWLKHYGYDHEDENTGVVKRKLHVKNAVDVLIRQSYRLPPFDPDRRRGRGAWIDASRAIINTGNRIICDGEAQEYGALKTRFFYEPTRSDYEPPATPATEADGRALFEVVKGLNWRDTYAALLLCGWIFLAPVCGALRWRPHIWITGSAGSGKSTVLDNFIARLVESVGLIVQGATTEAGLRQKLRSDALPVVFDEAEGTNQRTQDRMASVLELMRIASSEGGAKVIKGSAGGESMEFAIRSMFAFASITPGANLHQDKSRISFLVLNVDRSDEAVQRYRDLEARRTALLTDAFRERLHARAFRDVLKIRANCQVFSEVATAVLGARRAGDQVGTLLGGYWSLVADRPATADEARRVLEKYQWDENDVREESTEVACFHHLLSSTIRVETGERVAEYNVGTVVDLILGRAENIHAVSKGALHEALSAHGMRLEVKGLFVANQNPALTRIFYGTPFAVGWGSLLKRIPGAHSPTSAPWVGGVKARGTLVPVPSTE